MLFAVTRGRASLTEKSPCSCVLNHWLSAALWLMRDSHPLHVMLTDAGAPSDCFIYSRRHRCCAVNVRLQVPFTYITHVDSWTQPSAESVRSFILMFFLLEIKNVHLK